MAEMRRSKGPAARSAGGSTRGGPKPQKKTPIGVWIGLVVSPLILVGLIFFNTQSQKESPVAVKQVTINPNTRLKELENQVGSFKKDYIAWRKLMESEAPTAKKKHEELVARMKKWIEEWDTILVSHQDAEGNFPPEYQGYQKTRSEVSRVLSDILKSSGF